MSATGSEIKCAAKKAATWGTPVVIGANNGFLILPSEVKKSQPFSVDDSLGLGWPVGGWLGEIKVEGERKAYLRYDSLDLFFGMAMGGHTLAYTVPGLASQTASAGSATTLTGASGMGTTQYVGKYVTVTAGTNAGKTRKIISHTDTVLTFATMTTLCDNTSVFTISGAATTHVFTTAQNTDGYFFTLLDQIGALHVNEYTTVKCSGFTISTAVGKPVEVAFKFIAHNKAINTTNGTNTNTTVLNVTFTELTNLVKHEHLNFLMNASDGADFTDSDYPAGHRVYPGSAVFEWSRNQKGVYGVGGTTNCIDEPTNDGNPTCSLKFDIERHTAMTVALMASMEAEASQKIKITFTGSLLSGSTYRKLMIEIPNARLSLAEAPMVAGTIKVNIEAAILGRSAAPTGMAVTNPFQMTLVNGFGGDVLQEAI